MNEVDTPSLGGVVAPSQKILAGSSVPRPLLAPIPVDADVDHVAPLGCLQDIFKGTPRLFRVWVVWIVRNTRTIWTIKSEELL